MSEIVLDFNNNTRSFKRIEGKAIKAKYEGTNLFANLTLVCGGITRNFELSNNAITTLKDVDPKKKWTATVPTDELTNQGKVKILEVLEIFEEE